MGMLVDGVWHDEWYDTDKTGGHFVRHDSSFREWVKADDSARFPFSPGRYHLYVSYACPWAHRTLIVRALKQIESAIDVSVVHWLMLEEGWIFDDAHPDTLNHKQRLHEVYTLAQKDYSGRVTVPVLWDKQTKTIVNNESAEIIRMFNESFAGNDLDLYPESLRAEIDAVNAWVYDDVNNGVYKAGFATTQQAYEQAVERLFAALDRLESMLRGKDYLVGNQLTEADVRLFTTLLRFDPVYVGHFKCNRRRIVDYPHLWAFTRRIHGLPGVAETVHLDHIKGHYYQSHRTINPTGIVPVGPDIDFSV
ncbi:MAG: glutathione S-transferase family protein [Myxococcales bacterium]|nr:glutathione S-transferase family protein [Myxococcales bacterium]